MGRRDRSENTSQPEAAIGSDGFPPASFPDLNRSNMTLQRNPVRSNHLLSVTLWFLISGLAAAAEEQPLSVLFICIDDLNDWIEPLGGHPQAKTPHMTRLAKESVYFTRAYCASPGCNMS